MLVGWAGLSCCVGLSVRICGLLCGGRGNSDPSGLSGCVCLSVRICGLLCGGPGNSNPSRPVFNTHSCRVYTLVRCWTYGLQELPVMAIRRSVQDEICASCSEDACSGNWPHWSSTAECRYPYCYRSVCLCLSVRLSVCHCLRSACVSHAQLYS